MIAASKDFDTALDNMADGLTAIEDAQAIDEIKSHEGSKDYGYWFRAYTFEAKKLLAVAHKGDAAALGKAVAAFEPTDTAFAKFVADKGTGLAQAFSPYAGAADRFHAAVAKLARDPKGFDMNELVSAYNSLVNTGNSLYQLEGTPALE